jgi:hypothetical protein
MQLGILQGDARAAIFEHRCRTAARIPAIALFDSSVQRNVWLDSAIGLEVGPDVGELFDQELTVKTRELPKVTPTAVGLSHDFAPFGNRMTGMAGSVR